MKRASIFLALAAMVAAPAAVFAAESFAATLSGDAEVPPVTTDGSGNARVAFSNDETEIAYEVTFQDLSGPVTAAHIHYGSEAEAGGVIFPLMVGDSGSIGTLTERDFTPLDGGPQTFAEALDAIRDEMTYINLHTEANPGGEIRGQLLLIPDTATAREDASSRREPSLLAVILALAGAIVLAVSIRRLWVGQSAH